MSLSRNQAELITLTNLIFIPYRKTSVGGLNLSLSLSFSNSLLRDLTTRLLDSLDAPLCINN